MHVKRRRVKHKAAMVGVFLLLPTMGYPQSGADGALPAPSALPDLVGGNSSAPSVSVEPARAVPPPAEDQLLSPSMIAPSADAASAATPDTPVDNSIAPGTSREVTPEKTSAKVSRWWHSMWGSSSNASTPAASADAAKTPADTAPASAATDTASASVAAGAATSSAPMDSAGAPASSPSELPSPAMLATPTAADAAPANTSSATPSAPAASDTGQGVAAASAAVEAATTSGAANSSSAMDAPAAAAATAAATAPAAAEAPTTPAPRPVPAPPPASPTVATTAPTNAAASAPSATEIKAAAAAAVESSSIPTEAMPIGDGWDDGAFMRSLMEGSDTVSLPGIDNVKPDTYEPISIDEAVALALHNNYAGKASKETIDAAYWEKLASVSLYGPTVEIRLASGDEVSRPAAYNDANGNRVLYSDHWRRDKLYSVRQPIIDASVVEDILLHREREHYAQDGDRDIREGIAADTVSAYLNLLQASMSVKLAEDYREYLNRLGERMKARVEGGGGTPGDLERIQGRMTNAESARISAEGDYQNSLAEFKRLTHVVPARLTVPAVMAPAIPASEQAAQLEAEKNNAAYIGMLDKVDIARKTRDKSYSNLLPTLNVEYEHDYSYDAGGSAHGNPVDGLYPTQDDTRVMLVAHWLITGGYDAVNGIAGGSHVQEANFQAMDARMRLEQAVQSAYNAVASANDRISAVKKGVTANAHVVDEFEDQQKNGKRSLFELLDAYEQLYNSKSSLMRLVITRAQTGYLVHRQMGTLLPVLKEASEKAEAQTSASAKNN